MCDNNEPEIMRVEKASFGPVKVENGFVACQFTAVIDGTEVAGTYDPEHTKNTDGGGTNSTVYVKLDGEERALFVTLGPPGPNGLCGEAGPHPLE